MNTQKNDASFPLDNLTYDLVTMLHEKSKGLEAYKKYLEDAKSNHQVEEILQQLHKQDIEAVRQLRDAVVQTLSGSSGQGQGQGQGQKRAMAGDQQEEGTGRGTSGQQEPQHRSGQQGQGEGNRSSRRQS